MHSAILAPTPKKIMLEERGERRVIAQKMKHARGRLRKQKGEKP
jgi:hypothetical protein